MRSAESLRKGGDSFEADVLKPGQGSDVLRFQQEYDNDPDTAVQHTAARLMQSPHYGEHFARQWLDDVVDSVGQTFLAHPLPCAKCHDHKFDPVPTRDYYGMMAVFSTNQFADRDAAWIDGENTSGFDDAAALLQDLKHRGMLRDT